MGRGPRWAAADDEVVRSTMHEPARVVADRLGRTLTMVNSRRHALRRIGIVDAWQPKDKQATCQYCGISFIKKHNRFRYCSMVCANRHQAQLIFIAQLDTGAYERTCLHCGKFFILPDKKDPGKYCSNPCKFQGMRKPPVKKPQKPVILATCKKCTKSFIAKSHNHRYCSLICKTGKSRPLRVVITCIQCGTAFSHNREKKFCSERCDTKYYSRRSKHRDRARSYGVAYEAVSSASVFDRDGWRCQICGIRTPKTLRGTYDDCAPELDHIVPMALGGGHVWENVQCACRRCNIAKGGHSVRGQLNLFPKMTA